MKRTGLFLLALCLAGGAGAEEVPLDRHSGMLLVRASINKRVEGTFLLDTGATHCVLSEEVARRARIRGRTAGEKIQLTTANGPVRAILGSARRVEVGSAAARDVTVAVVEDDPVPGLAGILGLSFLQNFTYTVDREKGVLVLKD